MQTSTHNRMRSSSDPFTDPSTFRNNPVRTSSRPPVPPPKPSSKMPAPQRDITEPIRNTVTLIASEPTPRKVSRSSTEAPISTNGNARHTGRRAHSQDSVLAAAAAVEKAKAGKPRSKKGSQHADVIDRLDYTGGLFHHDGPFDACSPSRNRHRTKAPMLAWSSRSQTDGTEDQQPDDNLPPADEPYEPYYEPPKKKVDAIAEAWGIHEPEPFEEFFAGGGNQGDTPTSSIYGGKEGHTSSRSGAYNRRYRDVPDDGPLSSARRATNRRSALPPPQPIFAPDAQTDIEMPQTSPMASRPDGPKRSKSIMQRIRRIRDPDDSAIPSPPASAESFASTASGQDVVTGAGRPTHRSHHSFLGRFAGGHKGTAQKDPSSPTSEAFVYIEDSRNHHKELPLPPRLDASASGEKSYELDGRSGSLDLGRKSSLLKKVRDAVKGGK